MNDGPYEGWLVGCKKVNCALVMGLFDDMITESSY
jgi:hypothetical protein